MDLVIINGSITENSLQPVYHLQININENKHLTSDDILSDILGSDISSDYKLVLYTVDEKKIVKSISEIIKSELPIILLVDNYNSRLMTYLYCYTQFMTNSINYEQKNYMGINTSKKIRQQANKLFFSNIKDIADSHHKSNREVMNILLTIPNNFFIIYGLLLEKWNLSGDNFDGVYLKAARYGYIQILYKLEREDKLIYIDTYGDALGEAAGGDHIDVVELLLNKFKLDYYINKLKSNCKDIAKYKFAKCNNALIKAAGHGHVTMTKTMIDKYGARDYNGALNIAVKGGHMEIVRLMIDEYGARDYNGTLNIAAKGGHISIVELMIETYGATDYNMALKMAALGGHSDIIRLMIHRYGASCFNCALMNTARGGHVNSLKILMGVYGADNYNEAMIQAACYGHINAVKLLLKLGADNYNECMLDAAGQGYLNIVILLFERGATDYDGALLVAANINFVKLAIFILESDKILNRLKKAMKVAVKYGHTNMVKILLSYGGFDYDSIMEKAVYHGYIDIVKVLLDLDFDVDEYDPLLAIEKDHIDIVKLFLAKGLYVNNYGLAMEAAAMNNNIDIIKLFLTYGANNEDKEYALCGAAKNAHYELAKWLVDSGVTNCDEAALCAARIGYVKLVKLLLNPDNSNYDKYMDIAIKEEENNCGRSLPYVYK